MSFVNLSAAARWRSTPCKSRTPQQSKRYGNRMIQPKSAEKYYLKKSWKTLS